MNDKIFDENKLLEDYPDVLNRKQLQEILGFGKNKMCKLLQEQQIECRKIGREYRIPKINVIKFLLQNS